MFAKEIYINVSPAFSKALTLMKVALFLSFGLVAVEPTFAQGDITVQELHRKLASGKEFILIDVREPYEYEGFNIGGRLMPLGDLPYSLTELEEHKKDEIVVICNSGARSGQAQRTIQSAGFTNVWLVLGGLNEWKRAGFTAPPEVKPASKAQPPAKTPAPEPKAESQPTFVKIYVGNLSADTSEDDLRNAFAEYGEVKSVKIVKGKDKKQIGYVEIAADSVDAAIEALNETELDGNALDVKKAEPDKENE